MTHCRMFSGRLKFFSTLTVLFLCRSINTLVTADDASSNENVAECSGTADGECNADIEKIDRSCNVHARCDGPGGSIYRDGGSAQAYKPDAPLKQNVCDTGNPSKSRVALWPFSRGARGGIQPTLHVAGKLWSCSTEENHCCCVSPNDDVSVVEVWQARPDGTYSSLSAFNNSGDCRATVPAMRSTFEFDTLLPGSTGVLGGLGPFGWDIFPYGPPVIHFLVSTPNHDPLLVDIPLVVDRSLQLSTFWGPDFRGRSLASSKLKHYAMYEISSWDVRGSDIWLNLDFYLRRNGEPLISLDEAFCPSLVYGLPSSFFLEPISICAPSMLDYLKL